MLRRWFSMNPFRQCPAFFLELVLQEWMTQETDSDPSESTVGKENAWVNRNHNDTCNAGSSKKTESIGLYIKQVYRTLWETIAY